VSEQIFEPAPEVLDGDTADVYLLRTRQVMEAEGLNPIAVMEVFSAHAGVLCGMREAIALLRQTIPQDAEVRALEEGSSIAENEVVLRIKAPYLSYAIYETALLGFLASETGWATAATECVEAAEGIPIISFGARHLHPLVASRMDYAAIIGGCTTGSTPMGARLAGKEPSGTMPHAMILCFGDTVEAALAFDRQVERDVPRVVLVDTFLDEPTEALRVADALGDTLSAVRLDTAKEMGGVTPVLVRETRDRLDRAGFDGVQVFVSGGVNPDRIRLFRESGAPVDAFGVGSYIAAARPNDFTGDLKEVNGRPVAKRGRLPGVAENPRLQRVI